MMFDAGSFWNNLLLGALLIFVAVLWYPLSMMLAQVVEDLLQDWRRKK